MTLIGQLPGEGNRLHYHPKWNEWIQKGTQNGSKGDTKMAPKQSKNENFMKILNFDSVSLIISYYYNSKYTTGKGNPRIQGHETLKLSYLGAQEELGGPPQHVRRYFLY